MRCYSLASGRVLQQQWQDAEALKMPISAISRINCICKKQKVLKGLKFGDRQNGLIADISTGVIDGPDAEQLNNIPDSTNPVPTNAIQHDIAIEDDNDRNAEEPSNDNANNSVTEVSEADETPEDDKFTAEATQDLN